MPKTAEKLTYSRYSKTAVFRRFSSRAARVDIAVSFGMDEAITRQLHLVIAAIGFHVLQILASRPLGVRSVHIHGDRGEEVARELLHFPTRLLPFARCNNAQFELLHTTLGVDDGRWISSKQKLLIFLHITGHGCGLSSCAETFQHSKATISAVFHEVLAAAVLKHRELVRPPSTVDEGALASRGPRFWPAFSGCVGAMDGTHLSIYVRGEDPAPWRNRKGYLSQNVLAVVNFDRRFTYVLPGFEGSAHDNRVLGVARSAPEDALKLPRGYYLLADAGYTNTAMSMTPYRGVRYHLREQLKSSRKPESKEELFNLRHAVLRNVVERSFGILKNRFKILVKAQSFSIDTHIQLVYALTAVHNLFLMEPSEDDALFDIPDNFEGHEASSSGANRDRLERRLHEQCGGMVERREELAEALWRQYSDYLRDNES